MKLLDQSQQKKNLHGSINDFRVLPHAQVIVATPHRDVPPILQLHTSIFKLLGRGVPPCRASQDTEVPIRVVVPLLFDLAVEEPVVVQLAISYRKKKKNK